MPTTSLLSITGHGEGTSRVTLQHLKLRSFRNITSLDLALPAEGMVIVGENGHGKTNVLEAIYYVQLLRSFRGGRDHELVQFGADAFHIAAELDAAGARELSVGFDRETKRKRVRVNGSVQPRLADALGLFPSVIFSPRDSDLISGPPSLRRRFLDVMLGLTSRSYLNALQQYRSALANRNAALRDCKGTAGDDSVAVWERPLAVQGAVLLSARRRWVADSAARFAGLCATIGETDVPRMTYGTHLAESTAFQELSLIEDALRSALERKRSLDVRRGLTHTGPHRDDLAFTLGGRALRAFGSSGQHRTAAIALRLLEASTLRSATLQEPLVILDDPFAELDARRSARILHLLSRSEGGQTVLAVPRESDIPAELTRLGRWRISAGKLEKAD
ncbi:MAG: DNA replication/repair protein RecF [Gemmatimonadaceae bacterium]